MKAQGNVHFHLTEFSDDYKNVCGFLFVCLFVCLLSNFTQYCTVLGVLALLLSNKYTILICELPLPHTMKVAKNVSHKAFIVISAQSSRTTSELLIFISQKNKRKFEFPPTTFPVDLLNE